LFACPAYSGCHLPPIIFASILSTGACPLPAT
jgi:hypothetical protein